MAQFSNGESGASVRSKINAAITTVDSLGTDDNLLMTAAERGKLSGVEAGATADQTGPEIVSSIDTTLGQTDWKTGGGGGGATALDELSDVDTTGEAEGSILVRRDGVYVPEAKPTSSGNPAWGEVTGTLSAQTDLQAALDDRVTLEEAFDAIYGGVVNGSTDGLGIVHDDANDTLTITLNDGAMFRKSPWDASSGAFPTGAQNGYHYLVSTDGTVDGQPFLAGDYLLAIVDDASTTTYAANWERIPTAPSRYATADSAVQTYSETIGDGAATSIAVTHNLGTRDVIVQLYDATTFEDVLPDVIRDDENTITLTISPAPAAGQYQVVVQG